MSGPVGAEDVERPIPSGPPPGAVVEILASREATVGAFPVRRALPQRGRRTVGAWCFADHLGPGTVTAEQGLGIGPHPHLGLHTLTWLLAGEALHRDSLGSEQVIRPGQLNLMTAGHGIAHSEEGTGYAGPVHGVQLWIAQPSATRDGGAAFEHHPELPRVELDAAVVTVLVGGLAGARAPTRCDTHLVGADVQLRAGRTVLPVSDHWEHALVVLEGAVVVDGAPVVPGHLAYLGVGRDELPLDAPETARTLLLGGPPFPERLLMWWNYVARDRAEIAAAHADWLAAGPRFGTVASPLERIVTGPPPWPADRSGHPAG